MHNVNADIDLSLKYKQSELVENIIYGNYDSVKSIIQEGIDLNFVHSTGHTPLEHAVQSNKEIVELLIDHGAKLTTPNKNTISPLMMSCLLRKIDVTKILLERFPETKDTLLQSNGPLSIANRFQDRTLAKELYAQIDDPSATFKYTLLHQAAENKDIQAVNKMLSQSHIKEINQADHFGYSPLHLAVLNNHPEIVKILIEHGADINQLTNNGQSAYDLANQRGNVEIISIFHSRALHIDDLIDNDNIFPSIKDTTATDHLKQISNVEFRELMYSSIDYNTQQSLAKILLEKGFKPVIKDSNLSHLEYYLKFFDLKNIDFINCSFTGYFKDLHLKGLIENVAFEGLMCQDCEFDDGTIISNSVFKDSIFKNAEFNNVLMTNNNFFYTGIEDSVLNNVVMKQNHIYGSHLWNVSFPNLTASDLNIKESQLANTTLSDQTVINESRTKPIIGILGSVYELGDFSQPGFLAAEPYMRIKNAGAIPMLMTKNSAKELFNNSELFKEIDAALSKAQNPSDSASLAKQILHSDQENINLIYEFAQKYADNIDGIWIPGGPDIYKPFYGMPASEYDYHTDVARQLFEFSLVDAMMAQNKPVLGICHGAQLLNVYFGGTLLQHVDGHSGVIQPIDILHNNGHLGSALEGNKVWGLSAHHQAIDRLADPLEKVAEYDGIIKAAQHKAEPVWLSQFHPEYMLDDNNARFLNSFFDAAKTSFLNRQNSKESSNTALSLEDILIDTNNITLPVSQDQQIVLMPFHNPLAHQEVVTPEV